jgi:hypothetical protein
MVVPAAIWEDNSSGLVEVERFYDGDVVTYVSFDELDGAFSRRSKDLMFYG